MGTVKGPLPSPTVLLLVNVCERTLIENRFSGGIEREQWHELG